MPQPLETGSVRALPFEGFIAHLRILGFRIGIDQVLKLHQIVDSLDDRSSPDDLKLMLCAVFSKDSEQQERFYRAFESYFAIFFGPSPAVAPPVPPAALAGPKRRTYWWVAASAIALFVIAVLLIRSDSFQAARFGAAPLASLAAAPGTVFRQIHFQIPELKWLPWAALPLAVVLCLFWYSRPRWAFEQTPKSRYAVPLPHRPPLFADLEIRKAALRLRHRRPSQGIAVDIHRSIDATIEAQGNLQLQYAPRPSTPEYLILIDSSGPKDHQAILFTDLARSLTRESVHTSIWYYDADPRFCQAENQREYAYLPELGSRYPEAVLVLMGLGSEVVSPVTGAQAPWASYFDGWKRRILMTAARPDPLSAPALHDRFVIAPPTPAGWADAVAALDSSTGFWPPNSAWPAHSPADFSSVEALKTQLGAERFRWLCACAVYPELDWGLTMTLGEAILGPAAWDLHNLLALSVLPWFRRGLIPPRLRQELSGKLSGKNRRQIAEATSLYLAGALDARVRPRAALRVDLDVARLNSLRRTLKWLRSPLRGTAIVRSFELALGKLSRLLWSNLLRIAIAGAIGWSAWMFFERWPNLHQDVSMDIPGPPSLAVRASASVRPPDGSAQPARPPEPQPGPTRAFQLPSPSEPPSEVPALPTPPDSGRITPVAAPPAELENAILMPPDPPVRPTLPARPISSILGPAIEMKDTKTPILRFATYAQLPADLQALFANRATDNAGGAAAYGGLRQQSSDLAYLFDNLAKARLILPDGKELLSYFEGISKGGYYSQVWADPRVLSALEQMANQGALQKASVSFRSGATALYVTKESGADFRIAVLRATSGAPRVLLELNIGDGGGLKGLVDNAVRVIKGMPGVTGIYNRLLHQGLEPFYRIGSACDVDGNGVINSNDVNRIIAQTLGREPARNDLNGDGVVNVVDVQIVTNAVLTGKCSADSPPQSVPPAPPTSLRVVVH